MPQRNSWVTNLGIAIRQASKPVILVAHSLGCHAVAWWAAQEPDAARSNIAGAMMVAPPNVDSRPNDPRIVAFSPVPRVPFPFPTLLVGSENDHYCSFEHAQKLARRWGARFVNAGRFGHINADSDIGDWPYGLYLLADLLKLERPGENREAANASRAINRVNRAMTVCLTKEPDSHESAIDPRNHWQHSAYPIESDVPERRSLD